MALRKYDDLDRSSERCGAMNRSGNGRCRQPPAPRALASKTPRCRFHGGHSLRGPDHPGWIDGRTSIYADNAPEVLQNLVKMHVLGMGDGASSELQLVRGRISELLGHLEIGDMNDAFRRLRTKLTTTKRRLESDGARVPSTLNDALELCESGLADYQTWAEIKSLLNTHTKLLDVQRKIENDFANRTTREDWGRWIQGVARMVNDSLTESSMDERELRQIKKKIVEGLKTWLSIPYQRDPQTMAEIEELRRNGNNQ